MFPLRHNTRNYSASGTGDYAQNGKDRTRRSSNYLRNALYGLVAGSAILLASACVGESPKPVISVDCKPCSTDEVKGYELRLGHELNSLERLFGVQPDKPITFTSTDTRHFVYRSGGIQDYFR